MINSNFRSIHIVTPKCQINKLSLSISTIIGATIFSPTFVFAEEIFNPIFISDGLSNTTISDLSKFQNTDYQLPGIYRVAISVNDQYLETKDLNFVESTNSKDSTGLLPCLSIKMLENMGVNVGMFEELLLAKDQQCVDFISKISDSTSKFVFDKQKLNLTFPQITLKNHVRGYIPPEQWDNGITGLYTNYYVSGFNSAKSHNNSLFIGFENGLNFGAWHLRNRSNFSYNSYNNTSTQQWTNLRTYLQKDITPIKSQIIIGDGSTSNDLFDAFTFRGVNLSSDEAMYPDSQQGYAPTVRGTARTNAKVLIKQNGYLVQQINVAPGPFEINDLNPTSVSGDLNVTIEESDGTIQQYTIPYSSLPILQREGRTKYSITAGQFRSGIKKQDTPHVFQANATHGLTNRLSIYGGTQLSNKYQSALLGFGSNLGTWGATSFDVTHAKSELSDGLKYNGQSFRFLYAKSLIKTGTTFRLLGYRYSTKGFYTLSDTTFNEMSGYQTIDNNTGATVPPIIADYYNLNNTKKGRLELNISHAMGNYGSFFLTGSQQSYWGTDRKNEWYQAGYSNSWQGANYTLSVNSTKYLDISEKDLTITASIFFPLSIFFPKTNIKKNIGNTNISTSISKSSQNSDSFRTSLNGTLLDRKNLSYNLSNGYNENGGLTSSINVGYQGSYGNLSVGYNQNENNSQFNYSATGSALLHSKGITFGQSIGDAAVLIEVPKAKDVQVENYIGVKTNRRGYALIPYASAYRENRIALDTNSFTNNLEIETNVKYIVPIQGAISKVSFKPTIGLRVLATLSHKGKYIPYASSIYEVESKAQGIVADEGRAYITGLPLKGKIEAKWGESDSDICSAPYDVSNQDLSKQIIQIELDCK